MTTVSSDSLAILQTIVSPEKQLEPPRKQLTLEQRSLAMRTIAQTTSESKWRLINLVGDLSKKNVVVYDSSKTQNIFKKLVCFLLRKKMVDVHGLEDVVAQATKAAQQQQQQQQQQPSSSESSQTIWQKAAEVVKSGAVSITTYLSSFATSPNPKEGLDFLVEAEKGLGVNNPVLQKNQFRIVKDNGTYKLEQTNLWAKKTTTDVAIIQDGKIRVGKNLYDNVKNMVQGLKGEGLSLYSDVVAKNQQLWLSKQREAANKLPVHKARPGDVPIELVQSWSNGAIGEWSSSNRLWNNEPIFRLYDKKDQKFKEYVLRYDELGTPEPMVYLVEEGVPKTNWRQKALVKGFSIQEIQNKIKSDIPDETSGLTTREKAISDNPRLKELIALNKPLKDGGLVVDDATWNSKAPDAKAVWARLKINRDKQFVVETKGSSSTTEYIIAPRKGDPQKWTIGDRAVPGEKNPRISEDTLGEGLKGFFEEGSSIKFAQQIEHELQENKQFVAEQKLLAELKGAVKKGALGAWISKVLNKPNYFVHERHDNWENELSDFANMACIAEDNNKTLHLYIKKEGAYSCLDLTIENEKIKCNNTEYDSVDELLKGQCSGLKTLDAARTEKIKVTANPTNISIAKKAENIGSGALVQNPLASTSPPSVEGNKLPAVDTTQAGWRKPIVMNYPDLDPILPDMKAIQKESLSSEVSLLVLENHSAPIYQKLKTVLGSGGIRQDGKIPYKEVVALLRVIGDTQHCGFEEGSLKEDLATLTLRDLRLLHEISLNNGGVFFTEEEQERACKMLRDVYNEKNLLINNL